MGSFTASEVVAQAENLECCAEDGTHAPDDLMASAAMLRDLAKHIEEMRFALRELVLQREGHFHTKEAWDRARRLSRVLEPKVSA